MGNYLCVPCQNCVDSQIYRPPEREKHEFNVLKTNRSDHIIVKSDNENYISMIIVRPIIARSEKYLVFSHANNADIQLMFGYYKNLSDTCDINVVGYDYIGYGISKNTNPSEENCYQSFNCVMEYLLNDLKINPVNIYLVGHSLGTGVVVDYVSKNNWKNNIMLISPYTSICSIIMDSPVFRPIDKFVTIDKLEKLECPIKIVHGKNDSFVDISHAKNIFENTKNKKFQPTWLEKTGHEDILTKMDFSIYQEILE